MHTEAIIKAASAGYPDGAVLDAYNGGDYQDVGDTLAKFVASELAEVADGEANEGRAWQRARDAVATAIGELEGVLRALHTR